MTRVLLAGELAYNPERVLVLQEHGVELVGGLWIDDPLPFMTVGPLAFLPTLPSVGLDDWRGVTPDVIYAGLNWRSIPLVCALLEPARRLRVPIVLHFKEAPQRCLARGDWDLLARAHAEVDVRVCATALERDHLEALLPGRADPGRTHVMDGDLPPARWLPPAGTPPPGRIAGPRPATVLVGRPEGMDPAWLAAVTAAGIDLHVHHPAPPDWLAGPHVHRHPPVAASDWARVLGGYDAAWLHPHSSRNDGDPARASWDDCNLPARIPTALFAGLPLIADANTGHRVEVQDLIARTGAGVLHEGPEHLAAWLGSDALEVARERARAVRSQVAFDAHARWLAGLLHDAARAPDGGV